MISFIAHVSDPIHAELERLQLLFLLRLKDSFSELKEQMMKFLTLMSPGDDKEITDEALNQTTPRQPLLSNRRHDTQVGDKGEEGTGLDEEREGGNENLRMEVREWESVEMSDLHRKSDTLQTSPPNRDSQSNTVQNFSNPFQNEKSSSSASIAGCVLVHSLQVDILLPSIFSEKTDASAMNQSLNNTPVNTPSVFSPTHPSYPPGQQGSPCPPGQYPSVESLPTRVSPSRNVPPSPTPLALSHTLSTHTQHDTLNIKLQQQSPSPLSGSQLSVHSQTSQASVHQQITGAGEVRTVGMAMLRETGLTGSQTSLPILLETGDQSPRGHLGAGVVANTNSAGDIHRSISASNIAPRFHKTTPTLTSSPSPSSSLIGRQSEYVMVQTMSEVQREVVHQDTRYVFV